MKNFRYSGIEVDPLTGFKKKLSSVSLAHSLKMENHLQ
jgi:hypothetical protein